MLDNKGPLDKIKNNVTKNALPKLALTRIKDFIIPVPAAKEEQRKIAAILSTVDEKLDVLREKKGEYQILKKGLMQKILTGEIRVNSKGVYG